MSKSLSKSLSKSPTLKLDRFSFNIDEQDYMVEEHMPQRSFYIAMGLALALHAIIIFTVSFTIAPKRTEEPVLSLTIALVEQQGGEPEQASGEDQPPTAAVTESNNQDAVTSTTAKPQEQHTLPVLTTTQLATFAVAITAQEAQPVDQVGLEEQRSAPLELSRVQLDTINDEQSDQLTELPDLQIVPKHSNNVREKYINLDETATLEGFYAENWRLKIEHLATASFPETAKKRKLAGKLTLDVAINADGSVYSIELVRSSGHESLDNVARQVVLEAAPYEPFSEALRKRYDILHITRTWTFNQGG